MDARHGHHQTVDSGRNQEFQVPNTLKPRLARAMMYRLQDRKDKTRTCHRQILGLGRAEQCVLATRVRVSTHIVLLSHK